jgi:hypothetical protein
MSTPLTPAFRTTTIALNKSDDPYEVDVRVGGEAVNYVEMTPSQVPDPGQKHQMSLNEETPMLDNSTLPTDTIVSPLQIRLNDRMNLQSKRRVVKVFLKSGKDNTTFDVVALL